MPAYTITQMTNPLEKLVAGYFLSINGNKILVRGEDFEFVREVCRFAGSGDGKM